MKVIKSELRAVIERVTEVQFDGMRLFVFQKIGRDGKPCDYWVQNWECDEITQQLSYEEHKEITNFLHEHYKQEANS
jgi:hypothetical protein